MKGTRLGVARHRELNTTFIVNHSNETSLATPHTRSAAWHHLCCSLLLANDLTGWNFSELRKLLLEMMQLIARESSGWKSMRPGPGKSWWCTKIKLQLWPPGWMVILPHSTHLQRHLACSSLVRFGSSPHNLSPLCRLSAHGSNDWCTYA